MLRTQTIAYDWRTANEIVAKFILKILVLKKLKICLADIMTAAITVSEISDFNPFQNS